MIKRLFKAHIGLIQYICNEIKNKKTLKEKLEFLKKTLIDYLRFMKVEVKRWFQVFDKNYREQAKKHKNYQSIKKDLTRALKLLQYCDDKMKKQGWDRARRRQFWRDFFKDGQVRTDVFAELTNEVNQIN